MTPFLFCLFWFVCKYCSLQQRNFNENNELHAVKNCINEGVVVVVVVFFFIFVHHKTNKMHLLPTFCYYFSCTSHLIREKAKTKQQQKTKKNKNDPKFWKCLGCSIRVIKNIFSPIFFMSWYMVFPQHFGSALHLCPTDCASMESR